MIGVSQMNSTMIIREATKDDENSVREVNSASVEILRKVYRPNKAALARKTKRKSFRTRLVCVSEGRIVATVEYEKENGIIHILGPMVLPEYRRRGIARLFVNHLADIGWRSGVRALSLNTIKQTGNVNIFSRLGFHVVSECHNQWSESVSGEDLVDVYMERKLG
ncbi:GNAT family N-acetyltransferase [bacterium]|nr:GNAT family N-acetyltransferase [bacterium]